MIKVIQECDHCEQQRELTLGESGVPRDVLAAGCSGGWREVRTDKHLCAQCISTLIAK